MYCKNCGKELDEGTLFCDGCGVVQNNEVNLNEQKNKLNKTKIFAVLIIIAILLIVVILGVYRVCSNIFDRNMVWGWSEQKVEKFIEKIGGDEYETRKTEKEKICTYTLDEYKDLDDIIITCTFDDNKLVMVEMSGEFDDLEDYIKEKYKKGKKLNDNSRYWETDKTLIISYEYSDEFVACDIESEYCEPYEDEISNYES